MAKRKKTATRSSTKPVTVNVRSAPAPAAIVRAAPRRRASVTRYRRVRHHVGRARSIAGRAASTAWTLAMPQMVSLGAAGVLGLLQKQGVALPKLIPSLSTPANVGLAAWAGARFLKSPLLDHVATGCLAIAAHAFGSGQTVAGDYQTVGRAVVYDDSAEGEFDTEGDDEYDGG